MSDSKIIAQFHDLLTVEQYFKSLYKSIQMKLKNSNDYELSGTCSISVLIVDNKMYCINLGDSRCVLGQQKYGQNVDIQMSIEHLPTRDDEKRRIESNGGEVSNKIPGVARIFQKNDNVRGVHISRSIGDLIGHDFGVIAEPEVFQKDLESDDKFIVIGSGSIWGVMSNSEAVNFIFKSMETEQKETAKLLAEECRNLHEIAGQKLFLQVNQNNGIAVEPMDYQNAIDIADITCFISFITVKKAQH